MIFEICNEPTGVQWYTGGNDLYSYCKDIAGIIRDCGSKALIVCGTNNWSQDVEDVAKKPLKDDGFKDIMYTFHFYSGTHYEDKRQKVRTAVAAGTPIFVTEFGICDASGNGGYDTANADEWIEFLDSMNISYACWSFCNKGESASYLKTSCNKTTGGFEESDLTTTGIWLVNTYRAHQDAEEGTDTTASPSPSEAPTVKPTAVPTKAPTAKPTMKPTAAPTKAPTAEPTVAPTQEPTPGVSETPVPTPGTSGTPAPTGTPSTTPSPDKTPGASATPTPSGTTPGAGTGVTPQPSQSDTGLDDEDSTASSVKLRLAKKKLTIKRGKKKRIVVKVKVPGDKVKKYKVISGKKFVKVNAKGVVIAKKKGKATIKVIMKSGASTKCKVVVKK